MKEFKKANLRVLGNYIEDNWRRATEDTPEFVTNLRKFLEVTPMELACNLVLAVLELRMDLYGMEANYEHVKKELDEERYYGR